MRAFSRRNLLALPLLALGPSARAAAGPVTVFAASSLQTALQGIGRAWQAERGGMVRFAFAGSSALARQLEQGAPADLFLSADVEWMDWAAQRRLIRPETRRALLGNTLVLIEPASAAPSGLAIAPGFPLAAALRDSRLAMGQPRSVPAGRYAERALTHLGIWNEVRPRIAGAENVRAALAMVARGEARFGIVFGTDARTERRVRLVGTFPPESHPPVLYPVALTSASVHPDAAAFLAFLSSPAAMRIFEAEGFSIAR